MRLIKEIKLEGFFDGFGENKIFTLVSGEKFQQAKYKYKYHYAYRPNVKVFEDGGKYYLDIAGMGEVIEVKRVF